MLLDLSTLGSGDGSGIGKWISYIGKEGTWLGVPGKSDTVRRESEVSFNALCKSNRAGCLR